MRVGTNLGWGFGPAMGGFILSYFGFPGIFYFFTVTALIWKQERLKMEIEIH